MPARKRVESVESAARSIRLGRLLATLIAFGGAREEATNVCMWTRAALLWLERFACCAKASPPHR